MSTDVLDQLAAWCATIEDRIEPVTTAEVLDRRTGTGSTGRDSRSPVELPLRPTARGRRRLGWSIVAGAVALASFVGVWLARDRRTDRPATPVDSLPSETTPSETTPSETTPSETTPSETTLIVAVPRAEDELARLVAEAVGRLGWDVELPGAVVASASSATEAETYAEVRLALPGRGELAVSVNAGDADAAATGTAGREVMRSVGSASVYVGTDSDTARAVELFDGTTIVYVRSESTGGAQALDDLATIALDVDAGWAPGTLTFDGPPATTFETVPATTPATAPTPTVLVHHTSVRITLDGTLTCERPMETTGTFTSFVVDSYADLEGRRWLTRTTYPDGSTWERIALGDPAYADAAYSRGASLSRLFGCIDPGGERFTLVADPATGSFWALTMAVDLPEEDLPYLAPVPWPNAVTGGPGTDDAGRPAALWISTIDGFGGYGDDDDLRMHQTQTWWMDPADGGTVLQHRSVNQVDGLGTATASATLVTDEHVAVPVDLFDTTGARTDEVMTRPTLPPDPPFVPPSSDDAG